MRYTKSRSIITTRERVSSPNYLAPIQYYRGNPEEILRIGESKIERV